MWYSLQILCVLALVPALFQSGESQDSGKIIIPANETITVNYPVKPYSAFSVVQLHSQNHNISLSTLSTFPGNATKTGTNVGMTILSGKSPDDKITLYVKVNSTENVTAVLHIQFYDEADPLPGGCNQVFNLEIDPSVVVTYTAHWTQVWFQWSSLANKTLRNLCESKEVIHSLSYDVYVVYMAPRDLSETEFMDTVNKALTPDRIFDHGLKISSLSDGPNSESLVKVTSEESRGAIYTVVVTRKDTGRTASYVAAVTYACDFEEGNCSTASTVEEIVYAICLLCCGLFLTFVGHRFFKTTQVVFGFIFSCLLVYILMSLSPTLGDSVKVPVSLTCGVAGGVLWLAFWHFIAFPILSVFLAGLCTGYLVSSLLFFTPFGNISWWLTELNYSLGFSCGLLVVAVLLMPFTKLLSILSCGIVGSYMFFVAIAILIKSSLRLIFLQTLYRQTISGYTKVLVASPFFGQDIALITLWVVFAIIGVLFQFYRERGRPDFPVSSRSQVRVLSHGLPQYSDDDDDDETERNNATSVPDTEDDDDERRALLGSASRSRSGNYSSYQSSQSSRPRRETKKQQRNFLT